VTALAWLAAGLAAVMLVVSVYCVARLGLSWQRHRPTDRPVDATHALMGVAMAGMLLPSLRVLGSGGWEIVFAATAALFGWRAITRRASHDLQHVLTCGAMLYMLAVALPVSSGRAAVMHPPVVSLVLAITLLAGVVRTVDRLSISAPAAAGPPGAAGPAAGSAVTHGTLLSPRLAVCCDIAMSVTMGFMLITMA
jgi:hypothetical protein